VIAEHIRGVRTNIRFLTEKGKKPILLVTSPNHGEGKSTLVANLAVSMAQQKEKVLLIDANLREPSLHFIFKAQCELGLSEVLTGKSSFEDAVYQTEIGRLDVLPAGTVPHNPTELLGSDLMDELLDDRMPQYDVILIDSSGVLEVSDTKVLAGKCDGVIMVVSEGKTDLSKVMEAKKEVEFAKAKIMGIVVNQIK
jgi:capsular exopolysaccharide synthesis family protein